MSAVAEKRLASIVTKPVALASEPELRVIYVRHKPARGLVALHSGGKPGTRMACVSVDETTLRKQGLRAGATVRWFPDDPALRGLRVCCEPSGDAGLWAALERAASVATGSHCRLISADAAPLRYKPHDRCVLRYRLMLRTPHDEPTGLSVIGKAFRDADDARRGHAVAQLLHRRRAGVVARPLGLIERLALVLAADEGGSSTSPGVRAFATVSRGGSADDALRGAATALAVIHSCPPEGSCAPHPATREAAKVLARVDELVRLVPALGPRLRHLGGRVADSLSASRIGAPCLVHGSFKPSQLLVCPHDRVVVTDLDACCVADPALDLGYFLAYLRPTSRWHGNGVARAQYDNAARCFRHEYAAAVVRAGGEARDVESALARAPIYEAALLLKIATRRVHRLNSPRPHELEAIIGEAEARIDAASEQP